MDNVGDCDMKDIISNLPDCLLYILSLLPTKDAVGTSILAKRWKYLWTDLSVFNFKNDLSKTSKKENQIQESANCFLDLVDRLILHSCCRFCCIKRLRITLHGVIVDVDRVITILYAAGFLKVEDLKFSLVLGAPFHLPYGLSAYESLNYLCLEVGCVLSIPCGIYFPSLKTLKLSCVIFPSARSVQQLFSGCPVLQHMTLYNIDWKNVRRVGVTMSSLKTLTVYYDPFSPDAMLNCTIKIDAVNLVTFSITSYLTVQFVLVNLDSLVDAHVDFVSFDPFLPQIAGPRTINLLRGFGNIKTLRLSNDTVECLSYAKNALHLLPMFNNLTYLDVDLGATESTHEALMDILQKMPKLETLYIPTGFHPDVCMNGEDWILNSVPCCFKSCLKLFCISDFDGGVAEMELLKFVLKNSTVLGEIQLFCSDSLLADFEKQAEICDELQPVGKGSCVITFK